MGLIIEPAQTIYKAEELIQALLPQLQPYVVLSL
jgi:hypothetical protein